MTIPLYLAAATAGALYSLTPGPGVLVLLGIGAAQGRLAGAGFLADHPVGDVIWCGLALLAIIGARTIDPVIFDFLAMACTGYLCWLGVRLLMAQRRAGVIPDTTVAKPWRRGILFGITNPKSYPVALAMFTALLAQYASSLEWVTAPMLLAAAFTGFLAADLVLVWIVGLPLVRRAYLRQELWIIRATGALFIGFAANAFMQAAPGLTDRLAAWLAPSTR